MYCALTPCSPRVLSQETLKGGYHMKGGARQDVGWERSKILKFFQSTAFDQSTSPPPAFFDLSVFSPTLSISLIRGGGGTLACSFKESSTSRKMSRRSGGSCEAPHRRKGKKDCQPVVGLCKRKAKLKTPPGPESRASERRGLLPQPTVHRGSNGQR